MNDTTYAGYILDHHRATDLARENELRLAHREYGWSPTRPDGQPLSAWFRGVARTGRRTAAVASSH